MDIFLFILLGLTIFILLLALQMRWMISVAPLAPITAISAVGHA